MITLELIKTMVEDVSGIEDISLKTRKRNYIDLRSVYYRLATKYTYNSLEKIGDTLNLDHATVTHNLKNFKKLYGTNTFTANELYDICDKKLKSIYVQENSINLETKIKELDSIIAFCKKEKQNVLMDIKVEYEQIK